MTLVQSTVGTAKKPPDLRATFRYALRAQVVFVWHDQSGKRHEGQGVTRDLGHKGTYILALHGPPEGFAVELAIFLPVRTSEPRVLRMEAEAYVLRIDAAMGSSRAAGFAVAHRRLNLFAN
jgi:hypothetical protein